MFFYLFASYSNKNSIIKNNKNIAVIDIYPNNLNKLQDIDLKHQEYRLSIENKQDLLYCLSFDHPYIHKIRHITITKCYIDQDTYQKFQDFIQKHYIIPNTKRLKSILFIDCPLEDSVNKNLHQLKNLTKKRGFWGGYGEVKTRLTIDYDPAKIISMEKLALAKIKADETIYEVQKNIVEIIQLQPKLDDLAEKSEQLKEKAKVFYKNAEKLEKGSFFDRYIWWIILIPIGIILLGLFGFIIYLLIKNKGNMKKELSFVREAFSSHGHQRQEISR